MEKDKLESLVELYLNSDKEFSNFVETLTVAGIVNGMANGRADLYDTGRILFNNGYTPFQDFTNADQDDFGDEEQYNSEVTKLDTKDILNIVDGKEKSIGRDDFFVEEPLDDESETNGNEIVMVKTQTGVLAKAEIVADYNEDLGDDFDYYVRVLEGDFEGKIFGVRDSEIFEL